MRINNKNVLDGLNESLENWVTLPDQEKEVLYRDISNSLNQKEYPFFENNSTVILIFKGTVSNVSFLGDIKGWTDPIYFKQLIDTDLFYLKLELEPDARIQYQLIVDGTPLCDPSNKFKALHGLGTMSEIAMPGYKRHPYFDYFLTGTEGNFDGLIKHILPSAALQYEHEVYVYLPADYNYNKKYPVIYFQDGSDYIRFGLAPYSISRLIIEKKIKPCIAVFVNPPNLHQPIEPNRSTEYGLNEDYVKFFCDELVPFIDNNYSTERSEQERLVIGDSYAGLISLYIAFTRNDIFLNVYSQSGYFSFNNYKLLELINSQDTKSIKVFFDIGTYEKKVGVDFLPANELDFLDANRRMKEVFSKKGYEFIYNEYHEGHTWGNWRKHLIDALLYFYGKENTL